ncbi:MAG: membrane protein insertase YidC [Thermodesulfovibrionales bacterium]|nr:membrane protein insertase YidC [Thermodesulfovibrionales bacterium]
MEKRVLIAVVLSLLILVLYQQLFIKPVSTPQAPETGPVKKEEAPVREIVPLQRTPGALGMPVKEQLISVDTPLYRATLSSRCASFSSFELKKYRDKAGNPVNILKHADGLALCIGDDSGFYPDQLIFSIRGKDLLLSENNPSGSIVLEYSSSGISIRRTYTFRYDSYLIDIKDEVSGLQNYWVTLGGDFGIFEVDSSFHTGPVILKDIDRMEFKAKDLDAPRIIEGRIKWIALEDKYFFSGLVPVKEGSQTYRTKVWRTDKPLIALEARAPLNEYKLYAGPKEHDSLKALGLGLEHIIDFGFFSIVARPIFWILKSLYKVIGNYGWAIVILSVLIRIPFTPLITKGQKSMKKLQELQPRLEELRKKYKDDPKRLQMETMELYKKYKVNPFGGCLPILIQLPVFFALYKVLVIAIELRGAPFMLWIKDLSEKDPYYVLPVLMGATMIIQQVLTPSAGDPRQKKLMLFMSGAFTLLFLSFPSGLVLYWLTTNVLGIIHQLYLNRQVD